MRSLRSHHSELIIRFNRETVGARSETKKSSVAWARASYLPSAFCRVLNDSRHGTFSPRPQTRVRFGEGRRRSTRVSDYHVSTRSPVLNEFPIVPLLPCGQRRRWHFYYWIKTIRPSARLWISSSSNDVWNRQIIMKSDYVWPTRNFHADLVRFCHRDDEPPSDTAKAVG